MSIGTFEFAFASGLVDNRSLFALRLASSIFLTPCSDSVVRRCLHRIPVVSRGRRQEAMNGVCKLVCRLGHGDQVVSHLLCLSHDKDEYVHRSVVKCLLELAQLRDSDATAKEARGIQEIQGSLGIQENLDFVRADAVKEARWLSTVKDACRGACFQFMRDADLRICEDAVSILLHSTTVGNPDILSELMSIWSWHQCVVDSDSVIMKRRQFFSQSLEQAATQLGATVDLLHLFPHLVMSPASMSKAEVHFLAFLARKGDRTVLHALLKNVSAYSSNSSDDHPMHNLCGSSNPVLLTIAKLAPDDCVAVVDDAGWFHPLPQPHRFAKLLEYGNVCVPLANEPRDCVPRLVARGDAGISAQLRTMLRSGPRSAKRTIGIIEAMTLLGLPWVLRTLARHVQHNSPDVRRAVSFCIRCLDKDKWQQFNFQKFMDKNYGSDCDAKGCVHQFLTALEYIQIAPSSCSVSSSQTGESSAPAAARKQANIGQSQTNLQSKRQRLDVLSPSPLREYFDCSHVIHGFSRWPCGETSAKCWNCLEKLQDCGSKLVYMCENCDMMFCRQCHSNAVVDPGF